MMTFGGTPNASHVPPEWHKKIMHTRLTLDGQALMGTEKIDLQSCINGRSLLL
jgi:PhnB protein